MKLKFRSSLNKFNPFDSHQSDAKPIDLSLKSRIKNFMKKSSNDEQFKTSSNSLNSTNSSISSSSIHSISPTNSLNHQYDQPSPSIFNANLHHLHVPPSPPNSIEEDEEVIECIEQQKQIYYNQLRKQYENQQLNFSLTNLLGTSHLNQTNECINQFSIENATNLTVHQNRKPQIYNQLLLQCNSNQLINDDLLNQNSHLPSNLSQPLSNSTQTKNHIHYQKQMVIKHTSQMNKRIQNHYNPYSQASKRKYAKQNSDDDEELDDDYYDSSKLINKLRMKYCSSSKKSSTILNNQINSSSSSSIYNQSINYSQSNQANVQFQPNRPNSSKDCSVQHKPATMNDQLNNLQNLYRQYYNYLLSQPNDKLSAVQIIMKNILEQNNNNYQFKEEFNNSVFNKLNLLNLNTQQFKNSSIELQSLSSTPSPNADQTKYTSTENHHDLIYLPSTPPSLTNEEIKDGQNELNNHVNSSSINQQEERKRSNRPLTGRHVRQGTGASPTTLANLRLAIKERQGKSTSAKPIKRKVK